MYMHLIRARWILPAALLLGGGVLAMHGGHPAEAEAPRRPAVGRPVLVATVAPATGSSNAYTGVVAARTDSGLGFRVGGKIVERRVDPGDRVARGDTLLVLDVEDFELQLRAARNRLRAAESQLRQAQDDERRYRQLAADGAAAPAYLRAGVDLAARRPGGGGRRARRGEPDREPPQLLDTARRR